MTPPRPTSDAHQGTGLHVAIIMDGNGRWARRRGIPRREGHRAGAGAVRRTVTAAPDYGISTLTLYAFSSDNWRRPVSEVDHLMGLFRSHLRSETPRCVRSGVRVTVLGRRDRLPRALISEIEAIEAGTREGRTLHLQLAIDYSSIGAAVSAIRRCGEGSEPTREALREAMAEALHAPAPIPDVDLLIRTGGEQRLSDFLLWECAYAELLFLPCLWPDFTRSQLAGAVRSFSSRERRFGALPNTVTEAEL